MNKKIDLTQGAIWKALLLFAIPLFLGQFLQVLYHSIDSIVVGNFVNSDALASVNASSSISNMLVGFFTGLSTGIGVLFAKQVGAKQWDKLHHSIQTTMTFTFISGILVATIGVIFAPNFLTLLKVDAEIFESATSYLRIYMFGVMFTAIYNVGAAIVRSTGDSANPFYYLLISSIANIALDLLFVAVFHWGVNGVGYATIIAQFISLALVFNKLLNIDERYNLNLKELRIDGKVLLEVLALGLPAAIQSSITSIANIFTHRYINAFSKSATAGIPTAQKIDQFAGLAAVAVGHAIPTFISQNLGAKKYDRALKGVTLSVVMAAILTFVPGTVIYFAAPACAKIFTSDEAVIEIIVGMLHTIMPFYVIMGMNNVFGGIVRGFHKSIQASICNIFGMVIIRQIWLAISLKHNMVIQNIFWGYPIGWFFSSGSAMLYYVFVIKKEFQKISLEQ